MKANRLPLVIAVALLFTGCGDDVTGSGAGPWNGDWVLVNFLATDDQGVWDEDDPGGIGFIAVVTDAEWTLIDDFGRGCAVTMTYSVDRNRRFSRQAIRAGSKCPSLPLSQLNDSGRLEFSAGDRLMTEYFDLQPGDEIAAYRWARQ
jgi:hypothetical protein